MKVTRRGILNLVAGGIASLAGTARAFAGSSSGKGPVILFSENGGILGEGADNSAALAGAISDLASQGGGTLRIDDTYYLQKYVPLLPRVSIDLAGGRLINPTTRPTNRGYGQIFLPGNFHPAFTSKFLYHPADPLDEISNKIVLRNAGALFSPGDQIFVASEKRGMSTRFPIPLFGWLNVVEGVSGNELTLRYLIDVPKIKVGVANLKHETCRDGRAAFFWQDGSLMNGELECSTWHWVSDSAMLNCRISNMKTTGNAAIYGNTIQRTEVSDSTFKFRKMIGETSHNSLQTSIVRCNFEYLGDRQQSASGMSIQECARDVVFSDFQIHFNGAVVRGYGLRTIDAQDCKFKNGIIDGDGEVGLSLIQMGMKGGAEACKEFTISGNSVSDLIARISCGRVALLRTSRYSYGNFIQRVTSTFPMAANEAVRVEAASGSETTIRIRDCVLYSNKVSIVGPGQDGVKIDASIVQEGY